MIQNFKDKEGGNDEMMKGKRLKSIIALVLLLPFGILCAPGGAVADSRFFLVDGDDSGNSVTAAFINTTLYHFGIYENTGFTLLLSPMETGSFDYVGGDVPNFALDLGDSTYLSLLNDDAAVTYLGPIPWKYSQNPSLESDYYRGAWMAWNTTFPNITVEVTISDSHDGINPVSIPAPLILIGSGLIALMALHRRQLSSCIQD